MKQSQLSLDIFGGSSFLSSAHKCEWRFSCLLLLMAVLHLKYLFSALSPDYSVALLFLLLSEIFMESTGCLETNLLLRPVNVLCFLWRFNDCFPLRISIIIFVGWERIRISFGWRATLPDVPGTVDALRAFFCDRRARHNYGDLSAFTVCYKRFCPE
jgi:hypothetical protein